MGRVLAALLGVVIVGMPVANAEPVDDFVSAVAQQGFVGPNVVDAGYRVCGLLDQGVTVEGVDRFVQDTFHDQRGGYYAELFGTYAVYNLCPRHMGVYGQI